MSEFLVIILITVILFAITAYVITVTNINKKWKRILAVIITIEGIGILVQPNKVPLYIGAIVVLFGVYFLISLRSQNLINKTEEEKFWLTLPLALPNAGSFKTIFLIVGVTIIIVDLTVSHFFFNGYIGRSDRLVLLAGAAWIAYGYVPKKYFKERNFTFVFLNLLPLILVFPSLILGQILNWGIIEGWNSNELLVHFLLARPLGNILSMLGYDVFIDRDILYYSGFTTNTLQRVWIATACSGIYSVAIFISAFLSYLINEVKNYGSYTVLLLFLGIITAYISNLIRMVIIILVGIYWGEDALYWTHTNAGWLIFTFWIFVFWSLIFKFDYANRISEI